MNFFYCLQCLEKKLTDWLLQCFKAETKVRYILFSAANLIHQSMVSTMWFYLSVNPQDAMEIAASVFDYAGELGSTDALYTYAQLLRTGICSVSLILKAHVNCLLL